MDDDLYIAEDGRLLSRDEAAGVEFTRLTLLECLQQRTRAAALRRVKPWQQATIGARVSLTLLGGLAATW